MSQYDLLLKAGRVIDPAQQVDGVADVAVAGGRITEVAPHIPENSAREVINVGGRLVLPGLIDLHAHVYPGGTTVGIEADAACLTKGTTTVVDAGSAGAYTFEGLRRFIIAPSRTRILVFLNISSIGVPIDDIDMGELGWMALVNPDAAVKTIEAHRDVIVGIKVRLGKEVVWDNGIAPMHRALDATRRAGVPLMVHIGDSPAPLGEILDLMRPGDILTHAYTAFGGLDISPDRKSYRLKPWSARTEGLTLLDMNGRVIPEALAARDRGVIFDIGHGRGSFSYEVFNACMEQGLPPDVISTDLHVGSIQGPVYDLPTLMSRYLDLGMSLADVVRATTLRPAQALGKAGEIGALRPGAAADVSVLALEEGTYDYKDATGQAMTGRYRLKPHLTLRAGQIVRVT